MYWRDPWEAAPQLRDGERLTDHASAERAPAFGALQCLAILYWCNTPVCYERSRRASHRQAGFAQEGRVCSRAGELRARRRRSGQPVSSHRRSDHRAQCANSKIDQPTHRSGCYRSRRKAGRSPCSRADDDRSRPYGAGSGRGCARLSESLRRTGERAICFSHAPSRTNPCQHPWSDVGVPLGEGIIRLRIPSRPTAGTEELGQDHAVASFIAAANRLWNGGPAAICESAPPQAPGNSTLTHWNIVRWEGYQSALIRTPALRDS